MVAAAVIDIAELKRLDVFDSKADSIVHLKTAMPIAARYQSEIKSLIFAIVDGDIINKHSIRIETCQLKFGERLYFHCDATNTRCTRLYYWDGGLHSRKALYQRYGGSLLRRFNRSFNLLPNAKRKNHSSIPKETKAQTRRYSMDPRGTARAIDLGRGINQYPYFLDYVRACESGSVDTQPRRHWSRPSDPDCTTEYYVLDIRVLKARGQLSPDRIRGFTLGWSIDQKCGEEMAFLFNPYAALSQQITIRFRGVRNGAVAWQPLGLIQQRNRLFFECPVTKKATDILYLRNRSFASREGQRLYHPSQRVARPSIVAGDDRTAFS